MFLKKRVCLTYKQSYKWKRNHIFHAFGKINSTLSIVKKTQKKQCIPTDIYMYTQLIL